MKSPRSTPRQPRWHNSGVRLFLRLVRRQMGTSIPNLANEMGYSTGKISSWENGYTAPHFIELEDWAQALGYRILVAPITAKKRPNTSERQQIKDDLKQQMELALEPSE